MGERDRERFVEMVDTESNEDSDNDLTYHVTGDTPSKRLQNARGLPIARETITYNASNLLSNLAMTRLFVTANFSNYNIAYGAVGAVIVLMLWLWMSALVLLVGDQLNVIVGETMRKQRSSKSEKI